MASNPTVSIARGYLPGAIGRIVELHGTYYAAHWGFCTLCGFVEAQRGHQAVGVWRQGRSDA